MILACLHHWSLKNWEDEMYYQIRRSTDGKIMSGKAKRVEWTDESDRLFKRNGLKSFIGNARRYSKNALVDIDGNETPLEHIQVVPVTFMYGEPTAIKKFANLR